LQINEVVFACGHKNILATHKTTFEITKENALSKKGDCIIAVSASKSLKNLSCEFKENLRKENAKLTILIEAGEVSEVLTASGSPHLILTHSTNMVVRKSDYICNRTLAVKADKAADDLSRKLVEKLRDPKQKVKIILTVKI
jgi:hypothetical protein